MLASLPGFSWGTIIGDLLVALVLGALTYSRKQIREELVEPVRQLTKKFKKHIKDYGKFKDETRQSLFVLNGKLAQYENDARRDRQTARDLSTSTAQK